MTALRYPKQHCRRFLLPAGKYPAYIHSIPGISSWHRWNVLQFLYFLSELPVSSMSSQLSGEAPYLYAEWAVLIAVPESYASSLSSSVRALPTTELPLYNVVKLSRHASRPPSRLSRPTAGCSRRTCHRYLPLPRRNKAPAQAVIPWFPG